MINSAADSHTRSAVHYTNIRCSKLLLSLQISGKEPNLVASNSEYMKLVYGFICLATKLQGVSTVHTAG